MYYEDAGKDHQSAEYMPGGEALVQQDDRPKCRDDWLKQESRRGNGGRNVPLGIIYAEPAQQPSGDPAGFLSQHLFRPGI